MPNERALTTGVKLGGPSASVSVRKSANFSSKYLSKKDGSIDTMT